MSNIRVTVYKEWTLAENWKLPDFERLIAEVRAKIPEEHRDTAIVTIESEWDSSSISMEVWYSRKQTKEEAAAEREEREAYRRRREEEERRTLAALKAKYE